MTDFLMENALNIVGVIAIAVFIYVLVNWKRLQFLRRMVGLQFLFIMIHITEEMRFPGGMEQLMQSKLGFVPKNPHFGEMVLAIVVLIMFIPPLLFPKKTFLSMMPMVLGLVEVVMHTAGIWMYHLHVPYTPGMATAWLLLMPLSVYTIRYAVQHKLMRPIDWLFTFLVMIIGVAIAQQIVIRASGMSYFEFLGNIRKSMLSGK